MDPEGIYPPKIHTNPLEDEVDKQENVMKMWLLG